MANAKDLISVQEFESRIRKVSKVHSIIYYREDANNNFTPYATLKDLENADPNNVSYSSCDVGYDTGCIPLSEIGFVALNTFNSNMSISRYHQGISMLLKLEGLNSAPKTAGRPKKEQSNG